jgi:hypothetical protein
MLAAGEANKGPTTASCHDLNALCDRWTPGARSSGRMQAYIHDFFFFY